MARRLAELGVVRGVSCFGPLVTVGGHDPCYTIYNSVIVNRRQQGRLIQILMSDYRISKATVYRYISGTNPAQAEATAQSP